MSDIQVSGHRMQRLLRQLLLLFSEQHDFDTEELRHVSLRSFYHWLTASEAHDDFADICDNICVSRDNGETLALVLKDPFAFVDLVSPYWDSVRTISEPVAEYPSIVHVNLVLGYGEIADDASDAYRLAGTEFHRQLLCGEGRFRLHRGPSVTIVVGGEGVDTLTTLGCIDAALDNLRQMVQRAGLKELQPHV